MGIVTSSNIRPKIFFQVEATGDAQLHCWYLNLVLVDVQYLGEAIGTKKLMIALLFITLGSNMYIFISALGQWQVKISA